MDLNQQEKITLVPDSAVHARSWWEGDARVEPFMVPINRALDRSGLTGQQRTDVYNRAYEAVYYAIKEYHDDRLAKFGFKDARAPK